MNAKPDPLPIAVIGGGITGLSAAYHLSKQDRRVRLFEASPRLGGCIQSERTGGWLVEAGPNSLQLTPAVAALLAEIGLAPLIASPAAKNRYLVRAGRVVAAPASPPALFMSSLFSTGAKLRVLTELLMRPRNGRRERTEDVSLAAFAEEHFGREFVARALDPFVSGVYAGDATRLSARHAFPSLWALEKTHGSLLRGQLAAAKARRTRGEAGGPIPIVSFPEGLAALPNALATRLPPGSVELNARVVSVVPVIDAWQITWTRAGQIHVETVASVRLALPAFALAELTIGADGQRPLAALAEIEHPAVSSFFLGYRRDQIGHALDGFGLLVPPKERRSILGVLFNSTLFLGRAPEDHVALTVMTGGALQPQLATATDAELLPLIQRDLADLLGVRGQPTWSHRQVWPRAIPQYNLGYERFLDLITAVERNHPGLRLGGNARDGISLPNCLASGEKLAARATDLSSLS